MAPAISEPLTTRLDVRVISLVGSSQRRAGATEQLSAAGIDFRFFDALDGVRGKEVFERIDESRFVAMTGRVVQPGEIGCYASHHQLWTECVASGRPMLVLEDDFELLPTFTDALARTADLIDEYGYIRLQWEDQSWRVPVKDVPGFRLERYTKAPQETLCYAISPAAAQKLLDGSRELYAPVDVFLIREFVHRQSLYALVPYAVRTGTEAADSVIGRRIKVPKSLQTRASRTVEKVRRLVWRVKSHVALSVQSRASR